MTRTLPILPAALVALALAPRPTIAAEDEGAARVLFAFSSADASDSWRSVNDGVMGGVSRGSFRITDEGTLVFSGTLSLENNGGFASIRSVPGRLGLRPDDVLLLRVRGDGRQYLVNLYVPTARIASSYRAPLPTTAGQWTEVRVPLRAFVAHSFGRPVPGAGPVDPDRVNAIGITLSDKTPGDFTLEVASIRVAPASADDPASAPSPATTGPDADR